MNDLIQVKQLPVIEEHLRVLKEDVDRKVSDALALVCTADTVKTVKAVRADLNKRFQDLEEQRKAVKTAILAPYNQFEAIYKECASDAFKRADAELKAKISDVEDDMKRRCEAGLRDYFLELCESHHIDFVSYEQTGVEVSMADATAKTQPPKKLRAQLTQFIQRVSADVGMIGGMGDAEEIMVEYKRTLNPASAIATVQDRHRRLEEERKAREAREAAKAQEAKAVKRVEAFAPPTVESAPKLVRMTFTVTEPLERLKLLKSFMDANGFHYE